MKSSFAEQKLKLIKNINQQYLKELLIYWTKSFKLLQALYKIVYYYTFHKLVLISLHGSIGQHAMNPFVEYEKQTSVNKELVFQRNLGNTKNSALSLCNLQNTYCTTEGVIL